VTIKRPAGGTTRIREVFGVDRVLLPVIHTVTRGEVLESIRVAHAAGCHGVFLIDQEMSPPAVLALVCEARAAHPDLWIGVNLLSRRPPQGLTEALDACRGRVDGLWSDNVGIDEHASEQPIADKFVAARRAYGWDGLYFGGIAFKYQRLVADEDLGRLATLAASYVDVICTSGPGTGVAADVSKVRALRAGTDFPIALASGITPENVRDYLPYVDAYLVGTGIEERFGVLDPRKVEALLHAMDLHAVIEATP
jgi:predicted TIM-barrel enzyme